MKKKYVKPAFGVDLFTVAQSIAMNCGWEVISEFGRPAHPDKYQCGWDMGNVIIFLESMTSCTDPEDPDGIGIIGQPVGEDEKVEGICYNNPNGGATIFAS